MARKMDVKSKSLVFHAGHKRKKKSPVPCWTGNVCEMSLDNLCLSCCCLSDDFAADIIVPFVQPSIRAHPDEASFSSPKQRGSSSHSARAFVRDVEYETFDERVPL